MENIYVKGVMHVLPILTTRRVLNCSHSLQKNLVEVNEKTLFFIA